jgi:hypothetical protein
MVNTRQLVDQQIADTSARINKNIVIKQQRRRAKVTADATTTPENL